MKRLHVLFAATVLSLLLASSAFAQGRWMIGLRAGGSFPTGQSHVKAADTDGGEAKGNFKAKIGPLVSGEFAFWFNNFIGLGMNVEWERHGFKKTLHLCCGIGDTTDVEGRVITVSLLPTLYVRAFQSGPFSLYFSVGVGGNINSGRGRGDTFALQVENSFAVKPAVGIEWFLTPALALNAEVGWKLNRANFKSGQAVVPVGCCIDPVPGVAKGKLNLSQVGLLIGLRWYSP